jgi:hypothetical protein
VKRIEEMSLWERLYFPEVIRGLTHGLGNAPGQSEFVETKEVLMQRSRELDEKGKQGLYEEYVEPYRDV